MLPEDRISTHPGRILLSDCLEPLGLSASDLAGHIGVPVGTVELVLREEGPVTPDLAWRLAKAFGTSAEFWMNLQTSYDLTLTRDSIEGIDKLPQLAG